jgi:hypothetical protein
MRTRVIDWRVAMVALAWVLSACGASVIPGGDGGMGIDGGPSCALPNGERCPVGATCPAGDGCNVCACSSSGGVLCTLRACVSDGGPGPGMCQRASDCERGSECVFASNGCSSFGRCARAVPCADPGVFCSCDRETYRACEPNRPTAHEGACEGVPPMRVCDRDNPCPPGGECVYPIGFSTCRSPGTCRPLTDCARTQEYCGCDGRAFSACPGAPNRPTVREGGCELPRDAGAPNPCAGARLDPRAGACLNAAGERLAPSCCTGWNCDTSLALCDIEPPACPAGEVNTALGACFGPCVPEANCARPR